MKGLKENKGFTLIELLAVIVVLAIVMVLAVTTVLPYMNKARKEAFALEANAAKDAASNAMSLIMIGSLTDNYKFTAGNKTDSNNTNDNDKYCFTIENLKAAGLYEKDDTNYKGTIIVEQKTDKTYEYTVNFKNAQYYVTDSKVDVVSTAVQEGTPTSFTDTCS